MKKLVALVLIASFAHGMSLTERKYSELMITCRQLPNGNILLIQNHSISLWDKRTRQFFITTLARNQVISSSLISYPKG